MQLSVKTDTDAYLIAPQPGLPRLTRAVTGRDHTGAQTTINVVEERPLTIYLNAQEIVTAMTIGDYPEYLALGFLRNQGMLRDGEDITGVDYDEELEVVVGLPLELRGLSAVDCGGGEVLEREPVL